MFVEAIDINITTVEGNKYGRYVPFMVEKQVREINLIYGENTLGKSTLIESIIYALTCEDIYGTNRKSDVADYSRTMETFFKEKILESYVYLQVNNQKNRIVIRRNTQNRDEPIVVYFDVDINHLEDVKHVEYFKIKKDRNIRGNKTFQEFLFEYMSIPKYLNISDISVTDADTEGSSLIFYMQNLMPLFVVHQFAWDDIQAINPRYGLKDVKKIAFDILLGFSNTKSISDKFHLNILNAELRQKKTSLHDVEEVLSVSKYKDERAIASQITEYQKQIRDYEEQLHNLEDGHDDASKNVIKPVKEKYRRMMAMTRRYDQQINQLKEEIDEYTYYINKIRMDIEKIDKLKTAKILIGALPIKKCPHCQNPIEIDVDYELEHHRCSLCSHELMTRNYSKNDELLGYLIDEEKDFQRLNSLKQKEKSQLENDLFLVRLDLLETQKTVEDMEENLRPYSLQQYHVISREIGRITNEISTLEREKETVKKYEGLLSYISKLDEKIEELHKKIRDSERGVDDNTKLNYFQKRFKHYLFGLDFLKNGVDYSRLIDSDKQDGIEAEPDVTNHLQTKEIAQEIYDNIIIDKDDYYPKLEGRNLYTITSSSGLIRIILAYYLALLETALKYYPVTNHPLILIFDEPRQQNLDDSSFGKFTDYLLGLQKQKEYKSKFQIILASGDKGSLTQKDIALDLGQNTYLIEPRN